MTRLQTIIVALSILASSSAVAENWRGRICYATAAGVALRCEETSSQRVTVPDHEQALTAMWLPHDGGRGRLFILPPKVAHVMLDETASGSLRWTLVSTAREQTEMEISLSGRTSRLKWSWPARTESRNRHFDLAVPPDDYVLEIRGADIRTMSVPDIDARLQGGADLGKLAIRPAFVISGRITASGRERLPVVGALIGSDDATVRSDEDGRYSLKRTSAGPWRLRVTHPQYASATATIADEGDAISRDFELSRGGRVVVTVLLPESSEKVTAKLFPRERRAEAIAEIEGDGPEPRIVFERVPPAKYYVVLRGETETEFFVEEVEVTDLSEVLLNLTLVPTRLSIHVTRNAELLPDATVQISNRWLDTRLTTDNEGNAEAFFWQPGRFALQVTTPTMPRPYLTVAELREGGETTWSIDVPQTTLRGSVRDSDSKQPVAASIRIETITGETRASQVAETDAAGRFEAVVAAGSHELQIFAEGYGGETRTFVTTKEDREIPVEFSLRKLQLVDLVVLDSAGQPAANATVLGDITNFGHEYGFFATTDAVGRTKIASGKGLKTYFIIGAAGSFARAIIPPDSDEPHRVVLPRPAGSIRLTARTTDQKPAAGVRFFMSHNGVLIPPVVAAQLERTVGRFMTNDGGQALLSLLPAGRYGILPYHSTAQRDAFLRAPVFAPELEVDLGAGEVQVQLTFRSQ